MLPLAPRDKTARTARRNAKADGGDEHVPLEQVPIRQCPQRPTARAFSAMAILFPPAGYPAYPLRAVSLSLFNSSRQFKAFRYFHPARSVAITGLVSGQTPRHR